MVKKFYNLFAFVVNFADTAPLPPREQRHPFLRYQGLQYTDADIADFEERLERIYSREMHRVQVVDFLGMPELMRDGLFARMVMEHRDDAGVVVFTSQAWGRLFDTRGPLVRELILEFFSTLRFGEVLLDLDAPDTIQFASGRKSGAHISGGQFVARLAEHFGLLAAEILGGLTVIALSFRLSIWDAPIVNKGGQADPTPAQAPPPPAAARTMPQRMARLEEDVHEIRGALTEQRDMIDTMGS
ncbi:hypothetical protein Tco_1138156 [Tanacetum coccineum]